MEFPQTKQNAAENTSSNYNKQIYLHRNTRFTLFFLSHSNFVILFEVPSGIIMLRAYVFCLAACIHIIQLNISS